MRQKAKSFFDELMAESYRHYDLLFEGVESLVYLDVPDHPNVGDSAIFLGVLEYFKSRNIKVESATSVYTLDDKLVSNANVVALHGGGSFGGLYPLLDSHRMHVANQIKATCLYIICPQSVNFLGPEYESSIVDSLSKVSNLRIGVRDVSSKQSLKSLGLESLTMPDAAHFLPRALLSSLVDAPKKREVTFLLRSDAESVHSGFTSIDSQWLTDSRWLGLSTQIRKFGRYSNALARRLNPRPDRWKAIALKRLRRGITSIAGTKVLVTDRLHGMILGLQLGLTVIALDNSYNKLNRYAESWLPGAPNLYFAKSIEEANQLLEPILERLNP